MDAAASFGDMPMRAWAIPHDKVALIAMKAIVFNFRLFYISLYNHK
jgi:hypothetical protein